MSVDLLQRMLEDGRSAIGTQQRHPWVNPLFYEEVTPYNSIVGNLLRALETAKLGVLTDTITAAFGRRPTMLRAGRLRPRPQFARAMIIRTRAAPISPRSVMMRFARALAS